MAIQENTLTQVVTIANGQTKSAAIALAGVSILGIVTPAAIDGTTLTFEVSADGTTYVPLYDSTNALVSLTIAASRGYYLAPAIFAAWRYAKLVATQSTADRIYQVLTRAV